MINAIRRHPWLTRAAITTAVVGVIGVGVVLAEDLWVNVAYVDVRQGNMSAYPVIGTVKQGEKLTVVERQDDWVHVKYNNLDGWVALSDLSDKPVGASSMAGLGDSSSSGAGNSLSAKGFDEHQYAKAKGYNEQPFDSLEALYDVNKPTTLVKPDAIKSFMIAGNIGPKSMRGQAPQKPSTSENPLSPS